MELNRYNQTSVLQTRTNGKCTLRINKSGVLSISGKAAEMMDLHESDCIELVNDKSSPEDWYLVKSTPEIGFKLRNQTGKAKQLLLNSAGLANELFKILPKELADKKSILFFISKSSVDVDGETLWPILTSSAR